MSQRVRPVLAAVVVLVAFVAADPVAAQDLDPYPAAADLVVAETSPESPLAPGVADERHFARLGWIAHDGGFAQVDLDGTDLVLQRIDRTGAITEEMFELPSELDVAWLAGISDSTLLVLAGEIFGSVTSIFTVDLSTGDVSGLATMPAENDPPSLSSTGDIVGALGTVPGWADLGDGRFRNFFHGDNGDIVYDEAVPAVDAAGTVAVVTGRMTLGGEPTDVLVTDQIDGDASDFVRALSCPVATCEHEVMGVHVDGFFTNIYVATFSLEAGPGSDRTAALYRKFSSDVTDSMPVSAISPNGRFLVGNSQVGDEPEPSRTKLVIHDTETGRERLVSISELGVQTVFPLAISDDGLTVFYEVYRPCVGVCVALDFYTGWFELEPTAPVTNGPAADQIQRLYRAVFGRIPDEGGFEFWLDRYRNGESLLDIAAAFAASPEFAGRFGAEPGDFELIDALYRNVLGRAGDAGGVQFWLDQRADGMSTAQLLVSFADSPENIERTGTRQPITVSEGRILRLYRAVFGRDPDDGGLAFWVGEYDGGETLEQIAARFMDSPEFTTRYGDEPSGVSLIEALYRNVLGRAGDAGGIDFWTGQLDSGTTIPQLLVAFSDSDENVVNTGTVR